MRFDEFFRKATGHTPYPYQVELATGDTWYERLSIPTGVGKTAAAVLCWLFRRREHRKKSVRNTTPRRLVYCLPMRTLVEQTARCAREWLVRLDLASDVRIHLLMGGEDDEDWDLHPERDAILIGTQDMLLSRVLNRGYGMSRYRWPVHFGLLTNDCEWVLDEVQLMGSGLLTTVQLAAFAHKLWNPVKKCQFLWMSATLGDSFFDTRDRRDWGVGLGTKLELSDADKNPDKFPELDRRLHAEKSIVLSPKPPKPAQVLDEHLQHGAGRISLLVFNTVTAARNFFSELREEAEKRAAPKKTSGRKRQGSSEIFAPNPDFCLIHGRFRPLDRRIQLQQIDEFVSKIDRQTGVVAESSGLVLVSTQVVEAGFDISSVRLWSEIAPWSSVVQRLGRLNREGLQPTAIATFWRPKEEKDGENKPESPNAKRIGPYDKDKIETGQELLIELQAAMQSGAKYRNALDEVSNTDTAREALQVMADCVIRPDDMLELFSTDPDLAGGYTNVAQFVRDSDRNVDTQVFWRDFSPKESRRLQDRLPHRDELCAVPFFELREFVKKTKVSAFEWNGETKRWERRNDRDIWPGMTLMLPLAAGGYSDDLGWTGNRDDKPTLHSFATKEPVALQDEPDSQTDLWYRLADHLTDVEAEATALLESLQLDQPTAAAIRIAARWHDWGKSLPRWQDAVQTFAEQVRERIEVALDDPNAAAFHALLTDWKPKWTPPNGENGEPPLWAKFPDVRDMWSKSTLSPDDAKSLRKRLETRFNPRVRHEAASALAAWDEWLAGNTHLSALAVYLIASHHGKMRTVLRSTQKSDEVFGLKLHDALPPVPDYFPNSATLRFHAKHLGAHGFWSDDGLMFSMESPSWAEVVGELLGNANTKDNSATGVIPAGEPSQIGPFALAYLEAVLVAADIRASKRPGKSKGSQQ